MTESKPHLKTQAKVQAMQEFPIWLKDAEALKWGNVLSFQRHGFELGVGDIAKIISRFSFRNIRIICHVGFTILSEQYSQNNFPIIKTNHFKVTNKKKKKWAKIQIFVIILYCLTRTKEHITNTHNNIQIKQTVLYFQVQ